jgi:hypothetical protein
LTVYGDLRVNGNMRVLQTARVNRLIVDDEVQLPIQPENGPPVALGTTIDQIAEDFNNFIATIL